MESEITVKPTPAATLPQWLKQEALKVRGRQKDELRALVDWLKAHDHSNWPIAQCLLGHQLAVADPAASMRALVDQAIAELPKKSRDAILPLLGRVVNQRNQSHPEKLPIPEIPIRLPRPVPPFTADRWGGLAKYRVWSSAVLDDIVRSTERSQRPTQAFNDTPGGLEDPRIQVGRVLASAVLWGGVLFRRDLEMFYSVLSRWSKVSEFTCGRVYVTIADDAGNCRRWMPDAITAFLMIRLHPVGRPQLAAVQPSHRIDRLLAEYFRGILPDSRSRPASLFDFVDSCLLYFQLRLPPCLAEYAAGKQRSTSPNPVTWARMVGSEPRPLEPSRLQDQDTESDGALQSSVGSTGKQSPATDESDDWLSNLSELLGAGNSSFRKANAVKGIKARLGASGINLEEEIFLAYAADALCRRGRRGNRLKTIRQQVIEVAKRLPALMDLNDSGSLAAEMLASKYSLIMEDANSPSQHRKLRGYLRKWHHWLVETGRTQKIDEAEAFGTLNGIQAVDASLVLEDEYLRARDLLISQAATFENDPGGEKELRHIAGLILILGYRCGPRKMEVLKARLDDLLLGDPAEFLIRPWQERRLKTPNAIRKLPLYALLDPYELKLLEAWMQRRLQQNQSMRKPSLFLFFMPSLQRSFVPEGRVFPIIHSVLREVTGDEGVHFHTLRKSGAGTWLAFSLLRPQEAPLPAWLDRWPEQKKRIEQSASSHRRLYANEFDTRRHLFAIARTLGHGSPSVSASNYLELQSNLLSMWLDTEAPKLSSTQIQALAEVSQPTASNLLQKDLYLELWKIIGRRWKRLNIEGPSAIRTYASGKHGPKSSEPLSARERFEEVAPPELLELEACLMSNSQGATQEDLLWSFGYSEPFLNALLDAAEKASKLTVAERPQGKADRAVNYVHSFSGNPARSRLSWPTPVRTGRDFEVLKKFAARVFAALDRPKRNFAGIARHYLERCRNERNGLEFSWDERKIASEYAKFLLKVGVSPEECSIRSFGPQDKIELWKKMLPEKLRCRFERARPSSPFKAARNEIGIKVLSSPADTNNEGASSSYAWRYLMLMASLWSTAIAAAGENDNKLPAALSHASPHADEDGR